MHDPRTDRQTEMAMIIQAVERMAKRLKGRSVVDEDRKREFLSLHQAQRVDFDTDIVVEAVR
jgi:hypothetical protein